MRFSVTGRRIEPPDFQRMPQPHEKRETIAEMRARTGYVFIECDFTGLEARVFAQVQRS